MLYVAKMHWYCRWCGNAYKPVKQTDRDGFCCPGHKQAHYRAFKEYQKNVTAQRSETCIAV